MVKLQLIYIPICFYYFKIYPQSVTTQIRFTFQYVSIISRCRIQAGRVSDIFTFQYVSIISEVQEEQSRIIEKNLHSNMFLLFPKTQMEYLRNGVFTFQYVSIISSSCFCANNSVFLFTFQYVSIISYSRP